METVIKKLLEETGALQKGHFILSSGKHSEYYVQCARLFENPSIGDTVGAMVAQLIMKYRPQTIVGPAMGGIHLAYSTAKYMGIRNIFAEREKDTGKMALRRGFTVSTGEKVAVVEDVVTTGGSVKEVIQVLREHGADVVAVASIVYRGQNVDFGVPYHYLIKLDFPVYEPENCPLCKQGIPAVKPGSRK
ncbi:MAG: orotate phosphoribosyltransferase [Dictyoglomi bacterium]|nr:orotate phosphoribosyltransferase [Dictyoglomota bacterium]